MFGIITIAAGDKRYIEMAKMLALSLIQTNPEIKRAVVSDAPEAEFKGLFDIYIPFNASFGEGLYQKLHIDLYSPFEETLFIDADCLVFKSMEAMISLCRKQSFVVFGGQINSGEWYMDVAATCERFGLPSIPLFNGGTYYFNNKELAAAVYGNARRLMKEYKDIGFGEFRGSINEEPLIAVSMALNNVEAVDDKGIGMRTPIGIIGALTVDILNEVCSFNKEGDVVSPAILHFSGSYSDAFHYRREAAKLKLMNSVPFLGKKTIAIMISIAYNWPYSLFVFSKRFAKTLLRKEKFDFNDILPVFSNQ